MINYLKGILVSKVENSPSGCNITVEVNNIGYLVMTNLKIINSLPDVGHNITIYTTLIHKEDQMYLCGFVNREERDLFNILQTVSGVGVKVALLLLEGMSASELVSAVISDDSKALSRTKGVGPKLAKRLILELKDKMTNWRDKVDFVCSEKTCTKSLNDYNSCLEAESVLLSLGYTKDEAKNSLEQALSRASDKDDAEEVLRIALEWLANN